MANDAKEQPVACNKDHSGNLPKGQIETLENSQRDFWRHKCAGCAYEMGRADAAQTEANLRQRVRELQAQLDALASQAIRKA